MRAHTRIALGALLFIAACGGDSSAPETPANIAGAWNVAVNSGSGLGINASITLMQTDATITGSGQITGGPALTITGTVDGRKVELHFIEAAPCVGSLDLNGTINAAGTGMTGTVNGTDCHGSATAAYSASKQ